MAEPQLRADARRNRDRILAAARDAFAGSGFGVPLDEIAARAGVGPGTVYRHFPTKESLFQAVVTARVTDLVAEAHRRAEDDDPGGAFFGFLAHLGAEAAAKRDTSDAITVPGPLRQAMHDAIDTLLTRAQAAGAVTPGVTAADLVVLLKSLLAAVHDDPDPGRAERLLTVLTAGLRP
ncbi:helix-turn-helix transcriptional regulator [Dactylosporangium aurantiacum]|uniref:Helix-turn-helix transcriptional regulator n=1 Tax=Dactylosporangium aurantiacum TaxID=35754 RepID=A0A9Q9I9X7_9ACTN|nr:TetR/AcrR family transcriptional regulator [Dactylosporangium aurantiacum]MDG6109286.1 helix-turn-helix domain containing protein [Dactylosporangium aurantiacum]UWZ50373.1 helix-turn-helix transcriptional regulator [Dactylosporangium aurantiacum]